MEGIPVFVTVATAALLLVVVIKPADYADTASDIVYRGKGVDEQAIHKFVAEPMKQAIALQQALQQAGAKQILLTRPMIAGLSVHDFDGRSVKTSNLC